ncbi:MAG: NAD-dependent epimerase/dehydratase family protein [Chloroflexi bacterium]|nr:NAD-dependent epimerase/dehydratase family protein [Chloroflexota bacterium]
MKLFITGGVGFIGVNSADHFLQQGHEIVIFDNLSRKGGPVNLKWLEERHHGRFTFIKGDIRNYDALTETIGGADAVLHLASQVAVTTSVQNPREDFEINALGTFNVLEAARHHCPEAAVIYASTNKVYGSMEEMGIAEHETRYAYAEHPYGIPETMPLDFHSPYGCSKGAGDQYMIDYARIYGLRTLVFRQSCIYGRRQFGVEDQGWAAHFVIAAVLGRPISIFGDGKQIRDLLHVSDLIRAYELGIEKVDELRGQAFNIGGGPENTLAIWTEFGSLLAELTGRDIPIARGDWRPGDQRVFIADIRKAVNQLGWQPTISPADGILDLYEWVAAHPDLF